MKMNLKNNLDKSKKSIPGRVGKILRKFSPKLYIFFRKLYSKLRYPLIERPPLYKYPLYISYPRSGAHWTNSIMELYFNRPRLRKGSPSFLNHKNRNDWMWIHDHDLDLKLLKNIRKMKNYKFGKILFIYRNPTDVIYSYLNFKIKHSDEYGKEYEKEEKVFSKKIILKEISNWIEYHKEYLKSHRNLKLTILKYENFLDPSLRAKEFKKICQHFSYPFDKERINNIFKKYGKINLDSKNKRMPDEEYQKKKKKFVKEWKKIILERVSEAQLNLQ